jgi:hypothetical protein
MADVARLSLLRPTPSPACATAQRQTALEDPRPGPTRHHTRQEAPNGHQLTKAHQGYAAIEALPERRVSEAWIETAPLWCFALPPRSLGKAGKRARGCRLSVSAILSWRPINETTYNGAVGPTAQAQGGKINLTLTGCVVAGGMPGCFPEAAQSGTSFWSRGRRYRKVSSDT